VLLERKSAPKGQNRLVVLFCFFFFSFSLLSLSLSLVVRKIKRGAKNLVSFFPPLFLSFCLSSFFLDQSLRC
jgi:hypothetical protein